MKNVVIIQARMGSTRLPGKVLRMLSEKTVLAHVVERSRQFQGIHEIVIATTIDRRDDPIVEEAHRLGVVLYRGSEQDVLSRYYEAASQVKADTVIRITSDCPLIDPEISSSVIHEYISSNGLDYCSNTLERSFPRGLDTEVFSFEALEKAYLEAQDPHDREHVTPYLYRNQDLFTCRSVVCSEGKWDYRWTLDTTEDWELISKLYETLYHPSYLFTWREALKQMEANPQWNNLNSHIIQK